MRESGCKPMARSKPPCKDCPERHTACSDRCGKYAAWKAELQKIQAAEREYLLRRREDFLMSEQRRSSKKRYKVGKVYGTE